MKTHDVVIVGSGIVGATAALALAKQTHLSIALLEAKPINANWDANSFDYRVSAISLAAKKIFQNLNVWDSIVSKRISPYLNMHVWDAQGTGEIYFDCNDTNESALGFIIEDNVVRASLLEEIIKHPRIELLSSHKLVQINFQESSSHIELVTEVQGSLKTKLLIAADGANSLVRDLVNIELKTWNYHHTAIVSTLTTEHSHQHTARQRFLETGPLAFLPLPATNKSSIVWSTSPEHAEELLALDDDAFCAKVSNAFENKLGKVQSASQRYHFPLHMRHAKNYVLPRIALIGDAAHTIHPLAGQGVNLGLLDAACLVEVIAEAIKKNRDFSSEANLRRYERWRKSDNLAMLAGVEMLKQLFGSQHPSIAHARNRGLHIANRTQFLKNFFANYALGKRGDLPELAK